MNEMKAKKSRLFTNYSKLKRLSKNRYQSQPLDRNVGLCVHHVNILKQIKPFKNLSNTNFIILRGAVAEVM